MRKAFLITMLALVCVILAGTFALASHEFYGTVEKMPASGLVGEWVVDGRTVTTTQDTDFKEKHGKLQVGAYVEVEGKDKDGKFLASEIETKVKK